jgi:membrane protease YdiL (CAAX protease family)
VKRPLVWFFSVTFAVTWAFWTTAGRLAAGDPAGPAVQAAAAVFLLAGTFAPALVALALTEREGGRAATATLLWGIAKWRVGVRWFVFAVAFMPAIKLAVAVAYRLANGVWPRFGPEAWYVMAAAIAISTWVQAGEEIGWRGYALPRLSARFGLARASVILGVLWASWHLPLFLAPATNTSGQSFPVYVMQVTALSVAAAWLYWRTQGSLLLVMLLHASINNTKDIVPSAVPGATDPWALSASPVAWLTVGFLWAAAAWFLVDMARSPSPPRAAGGGQ